MAFKLISAEELFYQPLDPARAEMIIEDMIPQGLTLIAGAPKSGKSWMMLDMCLAVSSGRSFLGRKTLHCEVAYFPLEDQMPAAPENGKLERHLTSDDEYLAGWM